MYLPIFFYVGISLSMYLPIRNQRVVNDIRLILNIGKLLDQIITMLLFYFHTYFCHVFLIGSLVGKYLATRLLHAFVITNELIAKYDRRLCMASPSPCRPFKGLPVFQVFNFSLCFMFTSSSAF